MKSALLGAALFALAVTQSVAQEASPVAGIFCDTAEQAEMIAAASFDNDVDGAIKKVNEEVGDGDACVWGRFIVILGARGKTVDSSEGALDIVETAVVGVVTPYGAMQMDPAIWFTLAPSNVRRGGA